VQSKPVMLRPMQVSLAGTSLDGAAGPNPVVSFRPV